MCKRDSCFYIEFIATGVYRTGPSLLIFSKLVGRKPKPCMMKKSVYMVGGELIRARTILSLRSASLRREIVFHFIPDCVTQTREQTTRCHWCHPSFERLENKPSRQIGFNMKESARLRHRPSWEQENGGLDKNLWRGAALALMQLYVGEEYHEPPPPQNPSAPTGVWY